MTGVVFDERWRSVFNGLGRMFLIANRGVFFNRQWSGCFLTDDGGVFLTEDGGVF